MPRVIRVPCCIGEDGFHWEPTHKDAGRPIEGADARSTPLLAQRAHPTGFSLDKLAHHLSPDALFSMEGFEESDMEEEVQRQAFPRAAPRPGLNPCALPFDPTPNPEAAVSALLQAPEDRAVHSAVSKALHDSRGSLQAVAHMLARMGYAVRLHTSKGGNLDRLRHTYLTAALHTPSGKPAEWIIDPSFGQAFAVASPTPRYAHVMAAVPSLLVAPLPRLVRGLLLLGAELARCFQEKGVPLPPWRRVNAMATRYETVSAVTVHRAPAAEERKQQYDQLQRSPQQKRQQQQQSPTSICAESSCGSTSTR